MSEKKIPTKVFIVEIDLKNTERNLRSADARLAEAISLTKAINLDVVGSEIVSLRNIQPGMYIGKGVAERIFMQLQELNAKLVLMNCSLSSISISRTIEK